MIAKAALQPLSGHVDGGAVSTKALETERCCIAGDHHQGDEDIFAAAMQTLSHRPWLRGSRPFKPVAGSDPRDLLGLFG
jgi:hypothetical protein